MVAEPATKLFVEWRGDGPLTTGFLLNGFRLRCKSATAEGISDRLFMCPAHAVNYNGGMDAKRYTQIHDSVEALVSVIEDLRRASAQKQKLEQSQWKKLVADADYSCLPDSRDDPQLREVVATIRRAIRKLDASADRWHNHRYLDSAPELREKSRQRFHDSEMLLRSAFKILADSNCDH